jgi:hypothetical protein
MTREPEATDEGWRQHDEEQRRAWRSLSPRQRLRWLEQAKSFVRRALASARERRRRASDAKSAPPPSG